MTVQLDITAGYGNGAWRRGLREPREERVVERLSGADATLWGRYPVGSLERLGWLDARISLDDVSGIGGLCLRWMFATAVAGNLGVEPFAQPNVEGTKARATELLHQASPPEPAAETQDALWVRNGEDAT